MLSHMSNALNRLTSQLGDVDNLIDHHSGTGVPGRPSADEGPLNRSCVVLTYAAWEVFVEDSLVWAAQSLTDAAQRFGDLPLRSQEFAAENAGGPAALADDGWRAVFVKAVEAATQGDPDDPNSFGMNTAGPKQIASLHDKILGYRVLDRCAWVGRNNASVKSKLQRLVSDRGSIVHTGTLNGLSLGKAREYREFVGRLAQNYDSALTAWLGEQTTSSSTT